MKKFLALVIVLSSLLVQGQNLKTYAGTWVSSSTIEPNLLLIGSSLNSEGKVPVMGYSYAAEKGSKDLKIKTYAKLKDGRLYLLGKLDQRPFKAELRSQGQEKLELRMIIKDRRKGKIRSKTTFERYKAPAPDPRAEESKPGWVRLYDCKECEEGSLSSRGKGPAAVEVFIRSKKMKKTSFGFELPMVEMYLSFSKKEGRYALYEVPSLPVGEYELFVQYEEGRDDFIVLDPPPYGPSNFEAKGAWPVRVSLRRK